MRVARALAALLLTATGVGATGLAACAGPAAPPTPRERVSVSTGSPRGVYYAWGSALADGLTSRGVAVTVGTSSGSLENLTRVREGEATFALATQDATVGARDLVALARVYDDYLHVVVRAGDPITSLGDLAGRPVAVGSAGSGTAIVASRVLAQAHLRVHREPLDVVAGGQALREGEVDAVFWSGGVPTTAITDLGGEIPVRLLPLEEAVAERMRESYGGVYRPATVPAGSYGSPDAVAGLACANLLVARPDAPADAVRAVLATMFQDRARLARRVPAARALDVRTAVFTGAMALHPAAAAYYRDVKP